MSNTRPFLIADGGARKASGANPATASDVFTKPRRVVVIAASAQLGEIESRIPDFRRLQQLVPGDFAPGVRGCARHHARQRRLGALVRLVMKLAAVDALDE